MALSRAEVDAAFGRMATLINCIYDFGDSKRVVENDLLPLETITNQINDEKILMAPTAHKGREGYGATLLTISNIDNRVWTTCPYRYKTELEAINAVYKKYLKEKQDDNDT